MKMILLLTELLVKNNTQFKKKKNLIIFLSFYTHITMELVKFPYFVRNEKKKLIKPLLFSELNMIILLNSSFRDFLFS